VRDAWPLCVPEVPYRLPADALAHLTQRQEDTQSCTRGKRAIAGIAYKSTRLRSVPMPGTVCSTDRVLASCCVAVVTMANARSRSSGSY
jgi:hypothetical protein